MSTHVWWYTARAAGLVAWSLVGASVLWGLLLSNRMRRPRPAWTLDLHRFLGGLSVVFTVIHVGGLALDGWFHLRLADMLVPLASRWRPLPVALGVVGLWLLAAVEVTSLLMRRLPRRLWKAVHLGSYGLFVTSTAHALTAGSEAGNPVFQDAVLLVSALVVFLTLVRILTARAPRQALNSSRRPGVSQSHATRRPVPDTVM